MESSQGALVASIPAHLSPGVASLSVSNDQGVSLGQNGDLRRWPVLHKQSRDITLQVSGAVKSLAWSADGRFLHVTSSQPPSQEEADWQWWNAVWDRQEGSWLEAYAQPHSSMGAWSRDGRLLARLVRIGKFQFLAVLDFPTGTPIRFFRIDAPVEDLSWNASGTALAVSCPWTAERHTLLCEPGSGKVTTIPACAFLADAPAVGVPVEWSPEGRYLLIPDRAWCYEIGAARAVPGWPAYDNSNAVFAVLAQAWHPATGEIAIGRDSGNLEIRAADDGRILRRSSLHSASLRCLAWHPREPRLVSASRDGTIKVLDATTLEELLVFSGGQSEVRALAWSPDGTTLASGAADGSIVLRSRSGR
jgi:WD40 repeat protein